MADGVIYLDIDDEITSAAARIREVQGPRVAVVLPYGSRVATSRINFRLLARDALTHEKRLSVVAGDAAARALAASAGIPVFASVQEYEGSLDEREGGPEGATLASTIAAAAAVPGASPPRDPVPGPRAGASDGSAADPREDPDGLDLAGTAALVAASGATTRTTQAQAEAAATQPVTGSRDEPRVRGRRVPRAPWLIAAAVVAVVAIVGAVAAYLLLPSAEVSLIPRQQSVGPLAFSVDASTAISEPDVANGVVPALTVPVNVETAATFEATGERVEETPATGTVRFDNLDPTTSNTIARGAIVSTNGGIRFRTDQSVTVRAANLVGLTIRPSSATVAVTAVDPGPEGNVEPNAINTVPRGEEPLFLKVTNPDATTGGVSESFPRVTQEDIDAALLALGETLQTEFEDQLDDDDLAPVDVTVFPETAELGDPTYSLDPATLVGQEVETFDLGASATGSVLAVDTAPLEAIAEARLAESIDEGYELVAGSSVIEVDPAVVNGASITFPVRATAQEVAVLDAEAIADEIRGLPLADAQGVLDGYGTATISVWPEWVSTIPTIDGRLTVVIQGSPS
jgi:Baseplate J-like protein